jgi:replicative DNA helicase
VTPLGDTRPGKLAPSPKHPPHSTEAEQSVLGGLIITGARQWAEISGLVCEEDFYTHEHRAVWRALSELATARKTVDQLTLQEHLRQHGKLDEAGGYAYVLGLATETPSAANVMGYAEIVRQHSGLRALIALGQDIAELGYHSGGRDVADLLREADAELAKLRSRGVADAVTFGQATVAALEDIERSRAERAAGRPPGVPYGIPVLDRATGGMRAGELIGVAARTSVGKTAFAVQVSLHAAKMGHRGLFLTLEENPIAVALRGIASVGGVNLTAMRGGYDQAVQFASEAVVRHDLTSLPLWVDSRTFDLGKIRAKITRYARAEHIAFAVVDHILLVNVSLRNGAKRYEAVGEVTRTLKQTAEELGIPIIALAQLGRGATGRRPGLTDLRESGNIEQDLSTCIALHPVTEPDDESANELELEVGLLKNRYGRRGWMSERLLFRGNIQRFEQRVDQSQIDAYRDYPT